MFAEASPGVFASRGSLTQTRAARTKPLRGEILAKAAAPAEVLKIPRGWDAGVCRVNSFAGRPRLLRARTSYRSLGALELAPRRLLALHRAGERRKNDLNTCCDNLSADPTHQQQVKEARSKITHDFESRTGTVRGTKRRGDRQPRCPSIFLRNCLLYY